MKQKFLLLPLGIVIPDGITQFKDQFSLAYVATPSCFYSFFCYGFSWFSFRHEPRNTPGWRVNHATKEILFLFSNMLTI